MIVIARKSNSRVLKDSKYEVVNIWNDGTGAWREGSLI